MTGRAGRRPFVGPPAVSRGPAQAVLAELAAGVEAAVQDPARFDQALATLEEGAARHGARLDPAWLSPLLAQRVRAGLDTYQRDHGRSDGGRRWPDGERATFRPGPPTGARRTSLGPALVMVAAASGRSPTAATFPGTNFSTKRVATAFQKVLEALTDGDADRLSAAGERFDALAKHESWEDHLRGALDAAIQDRHLGEAMTWVQNLWDADYEAPYSHRDLTQEFLRNLRGGTYDSALPTAEELGLLYEHGEGLASLVERYVPTGLADRPLEGAELSTLLDLAAAYPEIEHDEQTLFDSVAAVCRKGLNHEDPRSAAQAADGLVRLGLAEASDAARLQALRKSKKPLPAPPVFVLGVVKPEAIWSALGQVILGRPADHPDPEVQRSLLTKALADGELLGRVAAELQLSREELAGALVTGLGSEGWSLLPFEHQGLQFPGELALASSAVEGDEITSHLWSHPAMGDCSARKLDRYLLDGGWMPRVRVSFADRVVPPEGQKHLVGRQKIISGDDVLRLYAAATAQPKWLAHDELVHHEPRPSVVRAIGAFVGLKDEEVERYFEGGGWGRLFHGSGDPLLFVDTPVYPGQIIREYLQVAGTAAPDALNDFLKAQTEPPAVDAGGKPVPFPVSDAALDVVFTQLKNKLGLSFQDPDKPKDPALQQLHESKAKASLKEWFENAFFFNGQPIQRREAKQAPHVDDEGPTPAVAQEAVGGAIRSAQKRAAFSELVERGEVEEAVRRDAMSRAMLEHVPGPEDEIASKDGSLKLAGFLREVAEQVRAETKGDAGAMASSNELTVNDGFLESMLLYAKNIEALVAPEVVGSAEPAPRPAPKETALDKLEALDAPEDARALLKSIFSKARAEQERIAAGMAPLGFSAHCRLEGNPGTGKTTVARIIVEGVRESGLLPEPKDKSVEGEVLETTGRELMRLARDGQLEDFFLEKAHGRGVLLDEIYQVDLTTPEGKHVADFLLSFLENKRTDTIVFAAGYGEQVEKFFASRESNPGFKSRFKYVAKFPDFDDAKLRRVLHQMAEDKGFTLSKALAERAIMRLTRFRGEGFGNARAVRNLVEQAIESFLDAGGPGTGGALQAQHFFADHGRAQAPSQAKAELAKRQGLRAVKAKFDSIDAALAENLEREELGMRPLPISLHAAFLGNPGTGKTTVGEDYGRFLKERQLLSKGELIRVTREDLVGSHEGDTERKVRVLLDRAQGCVLFLDEAYALHGDPYGNKAIDMLVGALKGDATDDLCLVMAGYDGPMERMFDEANPGLARRVAQRFVFEDFDDQALGVIISASAQRLELKLPDEGLALMLEHLSHERRRPNFGNAGSANNLLTAVGEAAATRKQRAELNTSKWSLAQKKELKSEVLLEDVEAAIQLIKQRQAAEIRRLDELIGVAPVKEWARRLELSVLGAERRKGPRPLPPGVIAIVGPNGCGKSAVSACIATELDRLKLLGGSVTKTVNAKEMLAGYLNQTVGQVNNMMRSGLGRVFVIRGLHELLEEGTDPSTAKEAISTIAKFLKENRGKLTVVLEGDQSGRKLQKVLDLGLREHLQATLEMKAATPVEAAEYFGRLLGGDPLKGEPELGLERRAQAALPGLLARLAQAPGWASYRDVEAFYSAAQDANADRNGAAELAGRAVPEAAWLSLGLVDLEAALENLLRTKGVGAGPVTELRLPVVELDGRVHYEATASVGGVLGEFVVDTGANLVTITPEFAAACGIDWKNARPVPVATASGSDAAYEVVLPSLNVGGLEVSEVRALVMNTPKMLLGMSFLREVDFLRSGDELVLSTAGSLREAPAPVVAPEPVPEAKRAQPWDPRLSVFGRAARTATEKQVATGAPPEAKDGAADRASLRARVDDLLYREMARLVADKQRASGAQVKKLEAELQAAHQAATQGVLSPALQQKIAAELKLKASEARTIAQEVAEARARAVEQQRKIQAEIASKKKRSEWVCSQCGNRNPFCPFNVKNNGIGNIGGFVREVPGAMMVLAQAQAEGGKR